MKKTIVLIMFIVFTVTSVPLASAADAPSNSAVSAILMDADSGIALYEKNADAKSLIASTTKIMTALVVLERCKCCETVEIKPEYLAGIVGSSMYLRAGEKLTVRDLLYGMLLVSGNDAANSLACYTSGSVNKFASLMNEKAKELGCTESSFKNPHGLDEKGHYSTAHDLALIAAAAMKNDTFREIVSTKSVTLAGRTMVNHNKLLWNYGGTLGVKTGYTQSAGRSLVSCVERDGLRLICVTLSDRDDWNDHRTLYDWAYGEFKCVKVSSNDLKYGEIPVISGVSAAVGVHPARNYRIICRKEDDLKILEELPKFVYAPVKQGARAGKITIIKNGETVSEIPIVFDNSDALNKKIPLTLWEKLKRAMSGDSGGVSDKA